MVEPSTGSAASIAEFIPVNHEQFDAPDRTFDAHYYQGSTYWGH